MTDRTDYFSKRVASLALELLVTVAALWVGIGPAMAQDTSTEPTVDVAIDESGTADLTIVMTYDLSESEEQAAFEDLQADDASLEELETRFADRMERVAAASAAVTDRSIEVTAVDVSMTTTDSTGIVELSATLTGLSAIEDGSLTLAEPFASGFQTDRTLRITVPDGYAVDSVTPEPDDRSDGTLTWDADRSLDGFELVASESGAATATSTPGMGLLAGGIAVLGVSLLLRRR